MSSFNRLVAGERDAGNGRPFFYLNKQRIAVAQYADVFKVACGKERTDRVTDVFIINRITDADRHAEEGRTNGDSLQSFEMNISHYETVCTVYSSAAEQQRRYEQFLIAIVVMRSS